MRAPLLLAACCLAMSGAPLSANAVDHGPKAYTDAVRAYQHGDVVSAAITLTSWSQRDLEEAGAAVLATHDWELVEAAAVLHTEITRRELIADPTTAALHLAIAEALVREIPSSQSSPFQPRWYAFAASVFLAETNPKGARLLIDRGLRAASRDPTLHVMSGAIQEMLAHIENPECSGPGCDTRGPDARAWTTLGQAEAEYRRGLDLDPQAIEARLRLGRVLFLQNRRTQAREELETVTQTSTNVRWRYLAHLFLGALDDYESHFTDARREYEAALKLGPEHQTPYIALSFAEQMTGAGDRARQTIDTLVRLPRAATVDPWLNYESGGLDEEALAWLRAHVHR